MAATDQHPPVHDHSQVLGTPGDATADRFRVLTAGRRDHRQTRMAAAAPEYLARDAWAGDWIRLW